MGYSFYYVGRLTPWWPGQQTRSCLCFWDCGLVVRRLVMCFWVSFKESISVVSLCVVTNAVLHVSRWRWSCHCGLDGMVVVWLVFVTFCLLGRRLSSLLGQRLLLDFYQINPSWVRGCYWISIKFNSKGGYCFPAFRLSWYLVSGIC